jgi:hypothetical protein
MKDKLKNALNFILVLVLAASIWLGEYRVQKVENQIAITTSQANANTQMANQAVMMVQNFYDHGPEEIVKLVRAVKCNCGQDKPAITTIYDD